MALGQNMLINHPLSWPIYLGRIVKFIFWLDLNKNRNTPNGFKDFIFNILLSECKMKYLSMKYKVFPKEQFISNVIFIEM